MLVPFKSDNRGPSVNMKCSFPFKFAGMTFYGCSNIGSPSSAGKTFRSSSNSNEMARTALSFEFFAALELEIYLNIIILHERQQNWFLEEL